MAKDMAWCNANIKNVSPGLLTMHGTAGPRAKQLKSSGMNARISIVASPAGGLAVTHARVNIPGVGELVTDIGTALGRLDGHARFSWLGGPVPADLRSGGGIPGVAAQEAAIVPLADIAGTGPTAAIVAARAGMLGLTPLGGGDPSVPVGVAPIPSHLFPSHPIPSHPIPLVLVLVPRLRLMLRMLMLMLVLMLMWMLMVTLMLVPRC